jgi:hypothetical protein
MDYKKLHIELIEAIIDENLPSVERWSNQKLPKQNSKNHYLKACWMLAKYNMLKQYIFKMSENQATTFLSNYSFLKYVLPKLRQKYPNK